MRIKDKGGIIQVMRYMARHYPERLAVRCGKWYLPSLPPPREVIQHNVEWIRSQV